MANHNIKLKEDYPWIQTPLIVGAPMRLIALAELAVEISKAGGIGFIGAGTDVTPLRSYLEHTTQLLSHPSASHLPTTPVLPIGIGFINWGASLPSSIALIAEFKPAAVWFFAPSSIPSLQEWTTQTRQASPLTKIWIQIGSVQEARDVVQATNPDVLVVQGTDAGGHGLKRGAGLISLLPEVLDMLSNITLPLSHPPSSSPPPPTASTPTQTQTPTPKPTHPTIIATGGLSTPTTASAALTLGATGIALGTAFLATNEARISPGYQAAILAATDGGQSTTRTTLYDSLRGTKWPDTYNARGVVNQSYEDAVRGMSAAENMRLYEEEVRKGDAGWGVGGRMTTYAGSGVGLVREVRGAGEVVRSVRGGIEGVLRGVLGRL
ncbi:inosine monophosphate dehydrogenase [Plenodomus tracheiphilus IPT5]|uniref:Inosine monophosphate dehydrogenase n=1 Tax=Plenodomus tracheiphilus IPT5 TaxID=1408161 RepID=A0A6A7BHR7_9PLEO|nr:inosine monophosphate dehydrogenase [Plenodomus tracheiphilus IPT5]